MGRGRAERVALVEAGFRIANERMAAWPERHSRSARELYYCECSSIGCREKVALARADYEAVRRRPERFFVLAGHVIEDLEQVVAEEDGFLVIEKSPDVRDLTAEADPRSPSEGPAAEEAAAIADQIEGE